MKKVCEYEGSSLWGMNGGQPESPDGTLLVYAKKPDLQNFQNCIWKLQIHPNPIFSRDGKRIYFNHPVSENRTEACFVEIDELLK